MKICKQVFGRNFNKDIDYFILKKIIIVCRCIFQCALGLKHEKTINTLKMNSSPYCAVLAPQCLWLAHDEMRIDVIRYEPLTLSPGLFKFFFQQSLWFLKVQSCFTKWYHKKTRNIKLCIPNGGWHETLNLHHVCSCEMLHFVTSYINQNKKRKQTLESAQHGLETIVNWPLPQWGFSHAGTKRPWNRSSRAGLHSLHILSPNFAQYLR